MKNELRDPLEKLSKSLRRAVSINKSKETDLKATMNTIQRERRRSFNAWSMRKEKFLRAKQNRVPVLHFQQATLPKRTKTDNSHNTKLVYLPQDSQLLCSRKLQYYYTIKVS